MKRTTSVIICLLLVVSNLSIGMSSASAASYTNWSDAYKDFVLNEKYLSFGQDYAKRSDLDSNIQAFALHDMNADGTPELIINDGLWYAAACVGYNIYQFYNNSIHFIGSIITYSLSYMIGTEFNGFLCWFAHTGSYTYSYASIGTNGEIKTELLVSGTDFPLEGQEYTGEIRMVEKTSNKKLFKAFCESANANPDNPFDDMWSNSDNSIKGLKFLRLADIKSNGWSLFLTYCDISTIYCNDVAIMCSNLCEAANDNWSNNVKAKYTEYGFKNIISDNYGAVPIGPFDIPVGSAAYTFGYKVYDLGNNYYNVVLAITTRGTTSAAEAIGDVAKGDLQPFLSEKIYDNVYEYEETVWSALKNYVNNYPEIKNANALSIVITGHSLGGAAANTIAARINSSIKTNAESWLKHAYKGSVYAYTFGAIKVFFEEGDNVTPNINNGYENIHNIYNYYDTYGPNGSESGYEVGSIYDKYGHTELFKKFYDESNDKYANHSVANYRDALNNHLVTCKGKDDGINTDNNSSFISRLVTGANRVFNAIKDFGKAFIDNMGNSVETVAVVVVNGFEKVATAIVGFFSGLLGG